MVSARDNTRPDLPRAVGGGRPRPPLSRVPTPNSAQTPRNTMLAPLRLARELRLCEGDNSASSSGTTSRDNERPRPSESGSTNSGWGLMCNAGCALPDGDVVPCARPTLPPRSWDQVTFFLRPVRPPSEWKLSASRASPSSSISSSSAARSSRDSTAEWGIRSILCRCR